ncbi:MULTISPECIES: glycosyltransferase family 2 protein [Bacillaceae]|uniref:glycosyltransferase family 2 protein n=1 Tax=Bacillaceae TaxID=186817 RepID=UPI0016804FA2|nr:glycosyltransferase [Bacillus sp. S3]
MDSKKLTVFMPVFNTEQYVKDTIDSILEQTYGDFEFLIIDDCSTDSSKEIIKSYTDKRIRLIELSKKISLPEIINLGLQLTESEYIAFIDSDDLATPDRLKEQVEFLNENQDIVAVSSDFQFFGSTDKYSKMPSGSENIHLSLLFHNPIANPAAMIRMEPVRNANVKHREDYFACSDYAFWVDLSVIGKLENINKCFLKYRTGHNNSTGTSQRDPGLRTKRKEILDKIHITALKNNQFNLNDDELVTFNMFFGDANVIIPEKGDFDKLLHVFSKLKTQAESLPIDETLFDTILREKLNHIKVRYSF